MSTYTATEPLTPTAPSERIVALDVARGVALLGIFLVNVHLMGDAIGALILEMTGVDAEGRPLPMADRLTMTAVMVFCAGKFYPLFSMLFGMGMVLSYDRLTASGHWFAQAYLRRLGLLLVIGLFHAWVLWYGDILVYYAVCGAALLIAAKWQARTLLIVGASVFVFGAGLVMSVTWLLEWVSQSMSAIPPPATGPGPLANSGSLFLQALDALGTGQATDVDSPVYIALEREANAAGPWYDALGFRLWNWSFGLVSSLLGLGWQVIGLFLVGAGLMRAEVLLPEHRAVRRRLMVVCLVLGLALAVLVEGLRAVLGGPWEMTLSYTGQSSVGAVLSLGYLLALAEVCERGWLRPVLVGLAATGRMALTNYLMQSVIASVVFAWWGLGLFGTFSAAERVGLVLAVFAGQVLFSVGWLSIYRMGPMEWVWRTATYWQVQPIHRASAPPCG